LVIDTTTKAGWGGGGTTYEYQLCLTEISPKEKPDYS